MKPFLLLFSAAMLLTPSFAQQKSLPGQKNIYEESFDCSQSINPKTFNRLLKKVRQQPTASAKRISAVKLASKYCLTSSQVYKLCKTLPLHADKLMLAKRCYSNCTDADNYDIVLDVMPTSALVNALYDYLVTHGYTPDDGDEEEYVVESNYGFGCTAPMSSSAFEGARQSIENAGFDETRLETAKTIAGTNCLKTQQVIELCNLLSFEQTKLDFAKYAYSHTWDKSNYFKVGTVFSFDASKSELNKFIQTSGK